MTWEYDTSRGRVVVEVEADREFDWFTVKVSGELLRDETFDHGLLDRCIGDALRQSARKDLS